MLNQLKTIEPKRLYTAFCMLIAVILIVLFHNALLLWSVLGVAYILAFYETYKLYNQSTPQWYFLALCIAIWVSVFYLYSFNGLFVALVILASYQAYTKKGRIEQMMPFIYPTIPFIVIYLLYLEHTINAIIWLLFIVALADSFAYFGGKLLGGKLFNNSTFCATSPNKTKEGVLVGVGCAVIVGTLVGLGVCEFFTSLILSLCASVASVFGDLYESYLKRKIEVKDSGNLFPGHGGILDRLDGYFFAGIILYALLAITQR